MEPDAEVIARFPCFATGIPAAATTSAAVVEMLKVPLRSPPVPHMSIAPAGASTRMTRSRIAAANPASSSTVSPRIRRATRSAASWDGVAAPSITAPIAARAASKDSVSPSTTRRSASEMASSGATAGAAGAAADAGAARVAAGTAGTTADAAVAAPVAGASCGLGSPGASGSVRPRVANEPVAASSTPASPSPHSRRKLARRCGPSGVRTNSGWNCTPSRGSVRWRIPMRTAPSSAVAVTTKSSGRVAGSTASEW